ncbi:hypothetical protein C8R45DRAFT_1190218 [Mycena sanguinolenta]|nr:hypothetical protein C8R45DRAFT_1190218 [Mycena sanguinolenta]
MSLQRSNSHPAQLENNRAIAPRTGAFTDESMASKKRIRDDATIAEELPQAKRQQKEERYAYCPMCHTRLADTRPRNKHMEKPICFTTAKRRELIEKSVTVDEWKAKAEKWKKSMSSNKLVHLKESSDQFQEKEKAGSRRSTPSFPVGSSRKGILSPASHESSLNEARGADATVASTSAMTFQHHPTEPARRSPAITRLPGGVAHTKQLPQPVGHGSAEDIFKRYKSIMEEVITGPLPCSQSVQRPRLQASASLGALPYHPSAPCGQLFSIHEPPRPSAGGSGASRTASPAYYASQCPSQTAGPSRSASRSSCNGNVNARSSTPSQQFHSFQMEYAPKTISAGPSRSSSIGDINARSVTPSQLFHPAEYAPKRVSPTAAPSRSSSSNRDVEAQSGRYTPNPYMRTDAPDHRSATPFPPSPQTLPSTLAQTSQPRSLQFGSSHPNASNQVVSANCPQAPANNWNVPKGLSRSQTFHPAQFPPINPAAANSRVTPKQAAPPANTACHDAKSLSRVPTFHPAHAPRSTTPPIDPHIQFLTPEQENEIQRWLSVAETFPLEPGTITSQYTAEASALGTTGTVTFEQVHQEALEFPKTMESERMCRDSCEATKGSLCGNSCFRSDAELDTVDGLDSRADSSGGDVQGNLALNAWDDLIHRSRGTPIWEVLIRTV